MTTGDLLITGESLLEKEDLPKLRSGIGIEHMAICSCGAVTLTLQEDEAMLSVMQSFNGNRKDKEICLPRELADEVLPTKDLIFDSQCYACNHCGNGWGVDLCACGSGEKFWECEEGHDICGQPAQFMPGLHPNIIRSKLSEEHKPKEIAYANVIDGHTCSD